MSYSPWGYKESDITEQLTLSLFSLQDLTTYSGDFAKNHVSEMKRSLNEILFERAFL